MLSTTGLLALEQFIKLVMELSCGASLSGTVQRLCGDSLSENAVPQHFEEHPSPSKGERCQVQFSKERRCQTVWQSSLTS